MAASTVPESASAAGAGADETEPATPAAPALAELSSPPMPDQLVRHDGKEYTTVKEGLAYILSQSPRQQKQQQQQGQKGQKSAEEARQSVFYNPVQQFNRDLSVLAIRAFGEHVVASKTMKHTRKIKGASKEREHTKGVKRKREEEDGDQDDDECRHEAKKTDTGGEKGNRAAEQVKQERNAMEDGPTDQQTQTQVPKQEQRKRQPFRILDALSASGLRALRYAKEIPSVTGVVANDLSGAAIDSMKLNIRHNGVEDIVRPHIGDACAFMYSTVGPPKRMNGNDSVYRGKFEVVDLDPYGTAAPFLDAAVQSVCDGGLICVTSTDAGVFAAVGYPEKTFSLYGGVPVKGPHSHEAGLRLILNAIAASAGKYGLAIEPLLSLSIDFYARIFVRLHRAPGEVKFTAAKTMMVYSCDSGCGAWKTQSLAQSRQRQGRNSTFHYHHGLALGPTVSPTCEHCGFKTHLAGPMWAGPLHNPHFIQHILDLLPALDKETYPTLGRLEGMLVTALEEDLDLDSAPDEGHTSEADDADSSTVQVHQPETTASATATATSLPPHPSSSSLIPRVDPSKIDPHPFFFLPSALSKVLHTQTVPEDMLRGALSSLGYRSTRSHAKPNSVRTDAPWSVVWEIMREWERQKSPVSPDKLREGTAGAGIMRRRRAVLSSSASNDATATVTTAADGEGAGFRALKRELLNAVEAGRDLAELRTKVEAALYRSGARRPEDPASPTTATATTATTATTAATSTTTTTNGDGADAPAAAAAAEQTTSPSSRDPSTLTIVFDEAVGRKAMAARRKKRLVRYQVNPRANWGPQTRAPVSNA